MAPPQKEKAHWLDRYATGFHAWTSSTNEHGQTTFNRPLGLVETSFDTDGAYYGGRADMTGTLTCEMRHSLSKEDFRHRIALAWTALRLRHVLLLSRHFDDAETGLRHFAVDVPRTASEAVRDVEESIVWIEDHYASVDAHDLHDHALNVARIISPHKCMSKLHVLPLRRLPSGTYELSFLIVMAHQISDGLSAYGWFKDLLRLLNQPASTIESEISSSLHPKAVEAILPPAQEDLYPPITGNRARQRWTWAIIRVLRHVKHTLPPTFANPLYRPTALTEPLPLDPKYSNIFSYTGPTTPPISSGHITAVLSPTASARLLSLCKSQHLSIGAGCFALAGLSMMHMHTTLSPTLSPTPAMTASFPLNPRAFFTPPPAAESCMLSFSDGIVLPFLPPELPLLPRLRLLARTANRELRAYQKRLRLSSAGAASAGLDPHSPARLLATGYVAQMERVAGKLPPGRRARFAELPQGVLLARTGHAATCGVSSVGSLKGYFRGGEYDLSDSKSDFVVDYRGLRMGVRAREGEFLVGSSTDAEGKVGFGVSYDACAIEKGAAEAWARTITGLLERSETKL